MTALHVALGVALIAVNALAAGVGALAWRRGTAPRAFWPLLRAGQALVLLAALDGAALLLQDRTLPELHLVYGLSPVAVAFVAEQLRLAAAGTVLDQHGLEGRADLELLSTVEQEDLVRVILRREMGVMAASAGVIAVLGVRASGLL
jgi:hypothetical protein